MFGTQNQQTGGGLFGSSTTGGQQSTGGLFGSPLAGTQNQQTGSGLFGGLGQNQTQQNTGLFGGMNQNNQSQPQTTGLFGSIGQNNQINQTNQNQNQPQTAGLFGSLSQNNQNQPQTGSIFGGQNNQQNQSQRQGGLFGQSTQQNQPQQSSGLFNGLGQNNQQQLAQSQQSQLQNSMWQPNSGISPREKSIPDQIKTVLDQWDTGSPNCAFQYYFYNKAPPGYAELFKPGSNEDPKKWDEALSKKPGPGFVPVLCTGFAQMGERIKVQAQNLAIFNARLHEINNALTKMLQDHDTNTSIRAMDAKRKHVVLKQRCLALATKVQVLRNRGYAMGGDEEDLKTKLAALDKGINDPGLDARQEEIWARMVTVQERAKLLKSEIEKNGAPSVQLLGEETNRRAQKILEDYQTQLVHLKKELDLIQKDYVAWEKDQAPKVYGR